MNTNLSTLIAPFKLTQFHECYFKNEPFLIPQVNEKGIKSLLSLPFLDSLESLLEYWPKSIQVHLPDLRDEASSIDTDAEHALSFYNQGMGLLFNDAQELSPLLESWIQGVRNELGLSAMTYGRNLIYATPDGKGTAPHFDQNINFVLQIKGIKKWAVASNRHLVNPMTRHTMGQPVDPEMMSYLERPMPTTMPADAKEYVLRPGSLLFVPRGSWHSTEAEGDALALNFTFTGLGGGVLMLPIFLGVYRFKHPNAVATSLFAVGLSSLSSLVIQINQGADFKLGIGFIYLLSGILSSVFLLKLIAKHLRLVTLIKLRQIVFSVVVLLALAKVFQK